MDESIRKQLQPGVKVVVTQQIPHMDRVWSNKITGTIVTYAQRPTGSWYAHSKDDRLWLDRLILRKADGELTELNLDSYTHLEIEKPAGEAVVTSKV